MADVTENIEEPDDSGDEILTDGDPWETGDLDDGRDDYPDGFTGPSNLVGPEDE